VPRAEAEQCYATAEEKFACALNIAQEDETALVWPGLTLVRRACLHSGEEHATRQYRPQLLTRVGYVDLNALTQRWSTMFRLQTNRFYSTNKTSRRILVAVAILGLVCGCELQGQAPPSHVDDFIGHPRVVVVSDIGNEPDDQMSFVRLLLYSNELDLEALIATTSTWQKNAVHPETMHSLIRAYGQVQPNLLLHASGWPTAEELESKVFAGQSAYGMAATGADKLSDGAKAIIRTVDRTDSRPVWICIWGGANTLAEALIMVRANRPPDEVEKFVEKLRVYSTSDQDDAGPWMRREFPGLFYIVQPSTPTGADYYYATWTGISGDVFYRNGSGADFTTVTNEWLDANIRSKGPLGKLYPRFEYIMEGDTPTFLGLIDNGLNAHRRPDWGGWGGRYLYRMPYGESHAIWTQGGDASSRVTSQDTVVGTDGKQYTSDQATIWRWREHFQNDFAARMSWCVADEFSKANHNPQPVLNGDSTKNVITLQAKGGTEVALSAEGTGDPDGNAVRITWWIYPEAGSLRGNATLTATEGLTTKVQLPAVTKPGTLHVILQAEDDGTPHLFAYRRAILDVAP